jgi:hypothetical protein
MNELILTAPKIVDQAIYDSSLKPNLHYYYYYFFQYKIHSTYVCIHMLADIGRIRDLIRQDPSFIFHMHAPVP